MFIFTYFHILFFEMVFYKQVKHDKASRIVELRFAIIMVTQRGYWSTEVVL